MTAALGRPCVRVRGYEIAGYAGPAPLDETALRSQTVKVEPAPQLADDFEPAGVPLDNVLDDREPQPGAAQLARAAAVDAVEVLGQARRCSSGAMPSPLSYVTSTQPHGAARAPRVRPGSPLRRSSGHLAVASARILSRCRAGSGRSAPVRRGRPAPGQIAAGSARVMREGVRRRRACDLRHFLGVRRAGCDPALGRRRGARRARSVTGTMRSSTSRVMRPACSRMILEEPLGGPRRRRGPGRASVSMKPTRRGERRLELVRDIGDEVRSASARGACARFRPAASGSPRRRRASGRRSVHRRAARRWRAARAPPAPTIRTRRCGPPLRPGPHRRREQRRVAQCPGQVARLRVGPEELGSGGVGAHDARWRSIRIKGSGTADMIASAAASRASRRPACSRQARSRRCIAGRIDRVAGLSRPSLSVVAAGSGPNAAATCRAATASRRLAVEAQ